MDTLPEGAWLTLREAARVTGFSVQTLRRRVKSEDLQSRRVESRYGPALEVWIESPTRVVTPLSSEVSAEHGYEQSPDQGAHPLRVQGEQGNATTLELVKLVRELVQRNQALSTELEHARETIRVLQSPAGASTAVYAPESA